jgi:mono/diheme cytochrome c family protein
MRTRQALLVIPIAAALAAFAPFAFAGGKQTQKWTPPNTALGEALFVGNCSACHTFKEAGATGIVGPNLDKYPPPSEAYIEMQITHGGGVMPAFTKFTRAQVRGIAWFVWRKRI